MKKGQFEAELRKWGHPTDIPTDIHVESDGEDGGGCNCGNEKKRKRLVDNFTRQSSLHGAAYIGHGGKKTSKCTRLFYRVLFGVSLVLVVVNVLYLLIEMLTRESTFISSTNKDVSLGEEEDPGGYFPVYPKITVCREPSYKTDFNRSYLHLVEYSFLSLSYPFVVLTPAQVTHLIQVVVYELKKRQGPAPDHKAQALHRHLQELDVKLQDLKAQDENFDIRNFIIENSVECQDFFLSCTVVVFEIDCCEIFRPVLTSLGLCYSLQNSDPIVDIIRKSPFEITLVMDLISPPKIEKATEEGFIVFLNDPLDKSLELKKMQGQRAPPGLVTTITSELIKFQRSALYTSWYGATTNCPKMPPGIRFKDDGERFSFDDCGAFHIAEKMRRDCDCEFVLTTGLPAKRYCEPADHYKCFIPSCMKNNLSDVSEKCRYPCTSYSYKSEASYVGLGLSNVSRIEINYNAKQYVSYEYRTTTLSGLLSQVGGALGLYLGASIITVAEIVLFCVSWTWYRIVPSSSLQLPTHHTPVQPMYLKY